MNDGSDAESLEVTASWSKKRKKGNSNGGLDLSGLIKRLGDDGKKIDPAMEVLLLKVSDYVKDRLREQEDEFTDQIHDLEKELARERQKRREAERNEEQRIRTTNQVTLRDRKDLTRSLRLNKRFSVGATVFSLLSLMIVGGLEIRRHVGSEVESVTVAQLEERVGSYDAALLAREKQLGEVVESKNAAVVVEVEQLKQRIVSYDAALLAREEQLGKVVESKTEAVLAEVGQLKKRVDDAAEWHKQTNSQIKSFMVARNDDTGMMNKIIDSYNYAVELMQFFSKTESERMQKEIDEYRSKLEERKQKIEKETEKKDE